MALSNIFKFTQGLGQGGHQIGRKVGDAIEILILGLLHSNSDLTRFLVVEDGVEGATSAKHKVEFSFYNLDTEGTPLKSTSEQLFGIIECKKVGVEQTIKQSFKVFNAANPQFDISEGYSFVMSPTCRSYKWLIHVNAINDGSENNIKIKVNKIISPEHIETTEHIIQVEAGTQILFATDISNNFHLKFSNESLSEIEDPLNKCIILQIITVTDNQIKKINVNEALAGPQTPEKAKQASFVSLDVRKKVLGSFDKNGDDSFISVLVIGEAGHWEEKSRSMVRLCNDHNLYIPDEIIVSLFTSFKEKFGDRYQSLITKSNYLFNDDVKNAVDELLTANDFKILRELDTDSYVKFAYLNSDGKNKLRIIPFEN
ncbi:hypothetical protein [Chryseobacterium sp. VAUSW3]|uniref:hypothetical protein n=1 Tax=Chryseobacterium sp. VAUSW3 TaxID=2010998 RepID=UPI000B4D5138|nr:hypothetical protein [Chryseobacterium sp. VAUSW3]OWR14482.1 hypothetical protein CDW55_09260 [Chryseobacterium sp. VAUSW3]